MDAMVDRTASPAPFLADYTFYERHEATMGQAPPARIIDAVAAFDMRDDPVVDTLLRVREWPERLVQRLGGKQCEPFGLSAFTPLHRDERELTFGLAGRFWRPDFGLVKVADADAFIALARNDIARLVLRFRVLEEGQSEARLVTETFVDCPSLTTKALMTPYWCAIRVASGWIRKRTLAAVASALATQP
ncbi:hypothetical protein [Paraburkholderia bannensis]|uniref:hypothetical protein n=1 Tax=Paraburkholderia bannensis TaxID=765414 RepID=UPI002AB66378|nr:hypothetical protein [Paraburkholderia bannensis]